MPVEVAQECSVTTASGFGFGAATLSGCDLTKKDPKVSCSFFTLSLSLTFC